MLTIYMRHNNTIFLLLGVSETVNKGVARTMSWVNIYWAGRPEHPRVRSLAHAEIYPFDSLVLL